MFQQVLAVRALASQNGANDANGVLSPGTALTRKEFESMTSIFAIEALRDRRAQGGKLYLEFLRVPTMSAGIYELAAGSEDPQRPHDEDEIYYVLAGAASIQIEDEKHSVRPGDIIYVPAHAEHRFFAIEEDLSLLVFFAPPES